LTVGLRETLVDESLLGSVSVRVVYGFYRLSVYDIFFLARYACKAPIHVSTSENATTNNQILFYAVGRSISNKIYHKKGGKKGTEIISDSGGVSTLLSFVTIDRVRRTTTLRRNTTTWSKYP